MGMFEAFINVLLTVLIILGILVLLAALVLLVMRMLDGRAIKLRLQRRRAERASAAPRTEQTDEIPEEVLVAILTAAAQSVLGYTKKTRFRVVSFRRVDTYKENLL
jgi:flagellar basal body-associated protein FliL